MRSRAKQTAHKLSSFAGIPRVVMESDDFKNLPANAVKLLLVFAYQYRGKNNGDLTAAFSVMRDKHGFKSQATLSDALKALLQARMITRTRVHQFMNPGRKCALYALTWQPIDECNGKLDCNSTRTPPPQIQHGAKQMTLYSFCSKQTLYGYSFCRANRGQTTKCTSYGCSFCAHRAIHLLQFLLTLLDYQGLGGFLQPSNVSLVLKTASTSIRLKQCCPGSRSPQLPVEVTRAAIQSSNPRLPVLEELALIQVKQRCRPGWWPTSKGGKLGLTTNQGNGDEFYTSWQVPN